MQNEIIGKTCCILQINNARLKQENAISNRYYDQLHRQYKGLWTTHAKVERHLSMCQEREDKLRNKINMCILHSHIEYKIKMAYLLLIGKIQKQLTSYPTPISLAPIFLENKADVKCLSYSVLLFGEEVKKEKKTLPVSR